MSSDDDVPVGFNRRKRLSSNSSFQQRFEPVNAQNVVGIVRDQKYDGTEIDL
jgi:hypothetical protein